MARSIPTYQRQALADGVQSAPQARSAVSTNSPIAEGLASIGQAMGNIGQQLHAEQRKKEEDRAAADVANVLSKGEVYWQEDFARRAQAWKPGEDMREGIGKDFDAWLSESEQKLPTEASKKYFRQHAISMKTRMQTNAFSYQEKALKDKLDADTLVGVQADENAVYADPARFDEVFARRTETILARTDIGDAEKIRQADALKRKLSLAVERGQMEKDPSGWYRARFGEPGKQGAPAASLSIAQAIYGQESSNGKADTSKVNNQNVTGPMQMQEAAFDGMKRLGLIPANYDWKNPAHNKDAGFKWVDYLSQKYNGDAAKVAAAYYGGEKAVAADGTIKRGMKNLQRPQDPTVGEYVDQVLGRMKRAGDIQVASSDTSAGLGMASAPDAPRTFKAMDWEQQSALRAAAEQKIKAETTKRMAGIVSEAAQQAVTGQDIGTDRNIDLTLAKEQALANARAKAGDLDETQRLHVEAAVERAAGVRERDRKRDQENIAQQLFDELDKNGGDFQAVRAGMAENLQKLPRDVVDRVQKYAGMVATGQTRETDWIAYAQLVDNPAALAVVNLPALRDRFSASEYGQLAKMQQSLQKAQQEGRADQTIQSDLAVVKGLLADAGVKGKDKEMQFFSALQREMDLRRGPDPKAPQLKQAEVKAIAADLLTREITHKGVLWDTKTPAFEITVPPVERAKIVAALNDAGLPVNDSTILRAYRNKLNKAGK